MELKLVVEPENPKHYHGKPCKKCSNTLKYVSGKNCVSCHKEHNAHYARSNRRKMEPATLKWRAANPDKVRDSKRIASLKKYGLSLEGFNDMRDKQNGRCAICACVPDQFYVDHCHSTGAVRGLLCNHCNLGLGHFKDTPDFLLIAVAYLNQTQKATNAE